MHTARIALPIFLASALLAGCGGGGSAKVSGGDVAVVGSKHITAADFAAMINQAEQSYKSAGRAFPKQGTTQYQTIKGQAVSILVQRAERDAEAANEGIKVTDQQVQARLASIKKKYFSNSETKYQAQLKKQHLTDAAVREDVRESLVGEAIQAKLGKQIKISKSDIHAYYLSHGSQYSQPSTRDVRYILVKKRPLAQSIFKQVKGASTKTWCKLAKKYSQDPSSKNTCGKATFSKGQTVPEFDKALFSLPNKGIATPIYNSRYGWFVLQALSPVHASKTTPESQVSNTIKQTLYSQKLNQALTDWYNGLKKTFCSGSKIKYGVGYVATPNPCAATTTTNQTTT